MFVARSSRIFLTARINDLSQRAVTKLFGGGGLLARTTHLFNCSYCDFRESPNCFDPLAATHRIESFRDFLIQLDMKPRMHLVEISIFSLNNVIDRITKIMTNLLEHLKILIFKVIFYC